MNEIPQLIPTQEFENHSEVVSEPIPHFVSDLPKINPEEARQVSEQFNLLSAAIIRRFESSSDQLKVLHAEKGLQLCRLYKTTPQGLAEILQRAEKPPSALELFDQFKEQNPTRTAEMMNEEQRRRESRDRDILAIEVALLKRRGIAVPQFSSLLEYCGWVPESTGHNARIRKWAEESPGWLSRMHSPGDVYWDLQKHYAQIIKNAQTSFDPLSDWQQYLRGELDITSYNSWFLQNMGEEDISYYSMSERWGGGARTTPSGHEYGDTLLTHSTSLDSAQRIVAGNYLESRVCYGSGQVVSVRGYPEVVFIFPKDVLQQTYSIASYTEPGGGHEREVRSNEINNIHLAIACVPLSEKLFPDYHGSGEGTKAMGRGTIAKWSKQYLETGRLWTDEEEAEIREIARQHQPKEKEQYVW